MHINKIILIIQLVLSTNSIFSKEYNELNICSEAGFIPFEIRTTTGKWVGYDIAILKMFSEDTERKINLIDMKFDGLIPALISNKGCDIIASGVGIDSERGGIVLFSDPTYQSAYAGIIRVENLSKFNKYGKINQTGVKIAVQQGTEAAEYVKNNFKNASIFLFEDNSMPINAVISNKVDIYIDDSIYSSIAVRRKISNLALVQPIIFPKNKYSGMVFAFRKKDVNFRDEFNIDPSI